MTEQARVLQNKTPDSALHLRRRIKGPPNVITLVPSPQADLFSQSKCHEIPCKELGWIPNKQSLSSCRNLDNFLPDKGSRLRNFKPPVCQQTVQKVELICYKHRHFNRKQMMKGREFKTWSERGHTWIFFHHHMKMTDTCGIINLFENTHTYTHTHTHTQSFKVHSCTWKHQLTKQYHLKVHQRSFILELIVLK